jgi:hypothetical protein
VYVSQLDVGPLFPIDSAISRAARVEALWNCSTPYCHLILSITYNIMSPFFFNSLFILVQYIILKLNVSSHPPVYENSRAAPPLILATRTTNLD